MNGRGTVNRGNMSAPTKSEAKALFMTPDADLGVADDARGLSVKMQIFLTYAIGGLGSAWLWPHLEGVSKCLVLLFALLAGISIHNGTWMANARDLRREQREQRREALNEAKAWIGLGSDRKAA